MLTVAKFYLFVLIFGLIVFYFDAWKRNPERKLRISKTLIPLEYTGTDHNEWKRKIIIERQILSIQNESDPELYSEAIKENIVKLINK